MLYKTVVSAAMLQQHLDDPNWIIIDCRFSLADARSGCSAYRQGHLPNARYADLNQDLSAPVKDYTGRHPLPDFRVLVKKLGQWGVSNFSQVVVYDDVGGAFAGRLWWLLRCLGHDSVAVLDGGITAWHRQGFVLTTVLPKPKAMVFRPYLDSKQWLNARKVQDLLANKAICLIDARTPARFCGEHEPIDPVAGHIPHALNRSMSMNLDSQGLFLPQAQLKRQFEILLGKYLPEQVVHQCGSGVMACHNLLAMEYAGLRGSKLYAGSWSEWICDKNRSVVKA
jgi:thiosulfate/3-mercaptopyruvate sulfurtransferase